MNRSLLFKLGAIALLILLLLIPLLMINGIISGLIAVVVSAVVTYLAGAEKKVGVLNESLSTSR